MVSRKKDYLPQSETEWLKTGSFRVETVAIGQKLIRCALAHSSSGNPIVTMIGGIPRDPIRQEKLPLINKLYGLLGLRLLEHSISSLLYNQPGTGGSSGKWQEETLQSRSETLVNLIKHFSETISPMDVALIGTSAGAYMAVSAIDRILNLGYKVSKLVLLSPAAYPEEIEIVPYGEEFTRLIRKPWDVATSPIFPKLKKFVADGGSLLISFFEADDPPIPLYIQEYYRNLMRELSNSGFHVRIMTIPGVAHNFRRIGVAEKKNVVDNESIRATANVLTEFLR